MIRCTLRGLKAVNYTSKRDNQPRSGYVLHYTYDDDYVSGFGCANVYISSRVYDNSLSLGDEFYILYNQRGVCEGVLKLQSSAK